MTAWGIEHFVDYHHYSVGAEYDIYTEKETLDGGKEGYFGKYLNEKFLPGYHEILRRRMGDRDIEHLTHFPDFIERIFVPLIKSGQAGIIKVTGEIPRSIAADTPDGYWDRFERLYEKQESLKNSPHPLVRAFCESDQRFSKDPDADITFANLTMAEVSLLIKKQFGIGENDVMHKDGVEHYRLYREGGLEVSVDYGSLIETKKDITLMRINIVDEATDEQIFHLDVGEFPKTVQWVVQDKRVVHATRKHSCQADLTEKNGLLYYKLPPESIQAMGEPETIYNRDLWSLNELSARSIRILCSHPVESLIDFEAALPQFERECMFAMQRIFRDGRRRRGEMPIAILFSVIKELIVSFDYDHLQAGQMLFDSEIAIPGLYSTSKEDRGEILRSDSFSVELVNGEAIPHHERDEAYLERQRALYTRGRKPNGERHYQGLKRFIEALVELKKLPPRALEVDEWEAFFDLFVEKEPPQVEIVKSDVSVPLRAETVSYALVRRSDGVLYRLVRVDGQHIQGRSEVEELIAEIANGIPSLPQGIDATAGVIQLIRERALGETAVAVKTLLKLNGRRRLSDADKLERAAAINRVYSVAKLILIVSANPSGLTPQQMEIEYGRIHGRFQKIPYREAFLEVKRLGLLRKFEMKSTTTQRHAIQPVDYYSLLPEGTNIHQLPELVRRNARELRWFYREDLRAAGIQLNEDVPDLEQVVSELNTRGVTLEVLESLTEIDFAELATAGVMTETLVYYANLVRSTLRRFYAEKYVEGESVPYVLRLTFQSAEAHGLIRRTRERLTTN